MPVKRKTKKFRFEADLRVEVEVSADNIEDARKLMGWFPEQIERQVSITNYLGYLKCRKAESYGNGRQEEVVEV